MQKYNVNIQEGKIGENGLASVAGWVKCYLANPVTREYMGSTMEYVMFDVSLSEGAYLDEPQLPVKASQAVRRTEDGTAWEIVDDYRGMEAFNTQTRESVTINFIGPLPEILTMHKPTSEFDRWDGHRGVEDKEAARKARIDAVRKHKAALSEEAETRIAQLERKVRLELASDEEKELLKAWEIYTIKLDDINPEITTDIKLPEKPE